MRKVALASLLALAACTSKQDLDGDAHSDPGWDALDATDSTVDPGTDTTELCRPMDARAEGPCAAIVPGVKWDGDHCVALGSGCGCAGDDCGIVFETVEECVEARRACYGATCEPQRVHDDLCIDCTDEMYLGAFWDGMGCYELRGCRCAGDGCSTAFASVTECEAVQSVCDSTLCLETGGSWYPGETCLTCGHHECGVPPPEDCCSAGCNCGPGRNFERGVGCVEDAPCIKESWCLATGGTWYPDTPCGPCGDYYCGTPSSLPCCDAGCDCGPARNFVEGEGCVPDPECGSARGELCTSTGGLWYPADPCGPCGDYHCGEAPLDACCDAGCDCGPYHVFDPDVGCMVSAECLSRDVGSTCVGYADSSNCRPGLVCCDTCGFAPCPACMIPCCEDSPVCMEDGCPMPTP